MIKRFVALLLIFLMALSLYQCAQRGAPTGGPKDETPPVLLSSSPESGTTNFNQKNIVLEFDEYVVTKNLRKQLIISPPMNNFPTISPTSASKKLKINISDTLKPNTTYVLNFGNSIQDNNEGNPYPFFTYVFSTGDYIDSLEVNGSIKDALTPKPDNFVTVMLYEYNESYKDSLAFTERPMYVTNTLDSLTTFKITNVKPGKYKLIAIKDKNSDYLFDPNEDKIAFVENPITVGNDSINYELTLFKQIKNYKASRPVQASDNRIIFGYAGTRDSIEITPISPVTPGFKAIVSKEPQKDTLNYWYSPKQTDSIVFTVAKGRQIDTFKVRLKDTKPDSLKLSPMYSSNLPMGKYFGWNANIPLVATDSSKITVMNKDSINIPFTTKLDADKLQYELIFETEHNQNYRIEALPGAMTGFFGQSNDTLRTNLKTKPFEDYAVLHIQITIPLEFPVILQLTDEKGNKIEKELNVQQAQNEYIFNDMNPGKYRLRVIEDRNNNGVWDTGNFLQHLQPEKIIYYPKTIELRANWEVEEIFTTK